MEKEENEIVKVNLEDFFTSENEENGKWFEPSIEGKPCGFEFLVTGAGTDDNAFKAEQYDSELKKAEAIRNPVERSKITKELNAKRIADFVIGFRFAKGCEVYVDGKPVEYSKPMIEKLFLKAPMIANEVYKFAFKTANFMNRKKVN